MPEISEIARAVHFIRKHLLNKTIAKCTAVDDANVYGKNLTGATTGAEFQKQLTGRKIMGTGQQGKYFWLILDKPPHPVMHFGMSGWLHFRCEETYYYRKTQDDGDDQPAQDWPPKFWKFQLETKAGPDEEVVEVAFADMRRFGRIRLVDCPGDQIRDNSPLVENGPDPVVDKDKVTLEWLREKCRSKKVPIKAMLLDQANISGIGNWVGDEIMYNAKIHPEQYANTLSDPQIGQLHQSIHYVCSTACDLLGDSEQFPEGWLFKHRWGKGKKDAPKTLPNGDKIQFLTVGGRTSAVVPNVQKKTGPVAKEIDEDLSDEKKPKKGRTANKKSTSSNETGVSKKRKVKEEEEEEEKEEKEEEGDGDGDGNGNDDDADVEPKPQSSKTSKANTAMVKTKNARGQRSNRKTNDTAPPPRRSTRRKT